MWCGEDAMDVGPRTDGDSLAGGCLGLGATRQEDAHGYPCQQRLLEEQQVLARQRWGSKAAPFTAYSLGQLGWCRGLGSAPMITARLQEMTVKQKEEEETVRAAPRLSILQGEAGGVALLGVSISRGGRG